METNFGKKAHYPRWHTECTLWREKSSSTCSPPRARTSAVEQVSSAIIFANLGAAYGTAKSPRPPACLLYSHCLRALSILRRVARDRSCYRSEYTLHWP